MKCDEKPLLEEDGDVEEERNERATREGFAKNRVVWFGGPGDWQKDYVFHIENSHTLVSMCRGHAMHQFDRVDRAAHLCCVLCMNLFISAWLQREKDQVMMADYYTWVAAWSVALVAYDKALRCLATSPCFQVGGSLHEACCRDCCRDCGRQGLYLALVVSAAFAIAGVALAISLRANVSRFFGTFVAMKLFSYLGELAPLSWTFYLRRERQRDFWTPPPDPKISSWRQGGAYPLGAVWPKPDFLIERRHVPERFAHVSKRAAERNAQARRRRSEERSKLAQRLDSFAAKRQQQQQQQQDSRRPDLELAQLYAADDDVTVDAPLVDTFARRSALFSTDDPLVDTLGRRT
ncbi:hypothetical protein CTAYLR_002055 [Chrysophaeum taylorii]|uniref:Uncharacterized protein n=1 Tax=Chrysophaeum taylorii TaxID=2483200 RepID=A0AAD7XMX4_9STRA|nr:hypothetical protein CTAYLR_002055 [Chrysophaeum taylorii]